MKTALTICLTAVTVFAATFFGYEIVSSYSQFAIGSLFTSLLFVVCFGFALVWFKARNFKPGLTEEVRDNLSETMVALRNRDFDNVAEAIGSLGSSLLAHYAWHRAAKAIVATVCGILASLVGLAAAIIAVEQNKLTSLQTTIAESEHRLQGVQTKLLEDEVKVVRRELELQEAQSILAEKQTKMLDEQNALAQASRQAVFSGELSMILDKIAEELRELGEFPKSIPYDPAYYLKTEPQWKISEEKHQQIYEALDSGLRMPSILNVVDIESDDVLSVSQDDLRMLPSESLVLRIVLFSRLMRPYYVQDPSSSKGLFVSPERAQLFEALRLSRLTMPVVRETLNLSFADFRESQLDRVDFTGALLKNARFDNSNLTNCRFSHQDLRSVAFHNADFFLTTFGYAVLPNLKDCEGATGIRPEGLVGGFTDDPDWLENAKNSGLLSSTQLTTVSGGIGVDEIILREYEAAASGYAPVHPSLAVISYWESPGFRVCLATMKNMDINSERYFNEEQDRLKEAPHSEAK